MRVGAEVHAAASACTSWLHLGLRVQLRSELFELCRGCRLTPISRCVLSLRSTLNQGPFPPRSLPASQVVWAPPTPGLRHARSACSGRHPAWTRPPVLRTSPCAHMPRPLPRWNAQRCSVDLLAGHMAFPVCEPGRLPRLPFRGLLGLHSCCGLQACSTSFPRPSVSGLRVRGSPPVPAR
jgi:hypothetical protein